MVLFWSNFSIGLFLKKSIQPCRRLLWDFPLYAVITINEKRNCFGPVAGQNLGRQEKMELNAGRKESGAERHHGATTGNRHAYRSSHRIMEMG